MNNKTRKLIAGFLIFFTLIFTLMPNSDLYAYSDLSDFNNYIENLDISYTDLSLTTEELAVIEELQQNGGITYGMYEDDNTVLMIFNQISKVFEIEVHQIKYNDYDILAKDVAEGIIDFSGSFYNTAERQEIFDFTTSTHRDKTFLYINHDVFKELKSDTRHSSEMIKIGYPSGFTLHNLILDSFNDNLDYEIIAINTMDEAARLLEANELDMVFSDITWYDGLISVAGIMALDYTDYVDSIYAGNITKKGTNQELISAINKMYAETDALIELQIQIDNYYEEATMYALTNEYFDSTNNDKIHQIYVSEYIPYVYQENGVTTGLLVELIQQICDSFGMKYEIKIVDDNCADYLSESGITVTMPVFVTDDNQEIYNLTIPVSESNMKIITIPDSNNKHFTKVSDLGLQKIGAINYNYMHDYTNEVFSYNQNIVFYDNLDSLIHALESQEIKFGVVSYEEYNKYAIDNNISNINVLNTIKLPQFDIAFGTPKTVRGNNTEAILSSALSIVNYSTLEDKYLSTNSELKAVYEYRTEALRSVIYMIIFLSLFVISTLCALIYINTKRANTDYLTKLRNRRTLEAYIKSIKTKKDISMAYIDLDNFKVINDVYGHHYGDKVLIYVGDSLKKLSHSVAFRVGGDEFIIVYNNKFVDFENDIKKVLGVTISIEDTDINIEGSIGNLNIEKHSNLPVEDIINLIDYAMISAKRYGKNLIIDIDDDLVDSYNVIHDLRTTLEKEQYEDSFKFYLESIIANNSIQGFYLIAKCQHKGKFIDYNEIQVHMTNKLIFNKIGLLIFEKLCMTINKINHSNNVKQHYLYDIAKESITEQNIEILRDILTTYNIEPKEITLRVDPTVFVDVNGTLYIKLLNTLGCKTSVDFSKITGASLPRLNKLDIAFLELNISSFTKFLTDYENVNVENLYDRLSTNLAISKLIDLCEIFKSDLLLYTSGNKFENLIIEYLIKTLKTNIYIIENDTLTDFEDYYNSL